MNRVTDDSAEFPSPWNRRLRLCHAVGVMPPIPASASTPLLLLGIDTCGPSGSVALARKTGPELEVLAQTELEGRTYSATLVTAVRELLTGHAIGLRQIGCIVVVNGPGSFTGVRVGLSAVKGLAEAAGIRVVSVSRLAVLARKAGTASSALDAHRHEVFLRVSDVATGVKELLAGADELNKDVPWPGQIAVCDETASLLLASAWPDAELIRVAAPTAADALEVALPLIDSGEFADIALLDGHYLRRSDAEIFGDPGATAKRA